jgi:hypothetical protein
MAAEYFGLLRTLNLVTLIFVGSRRLKEMKG